MLIDTWQINSLSARWRRTNSLPSHGCR